MANVRVLLADDHSIVRRGLRAVIEAEADMQVVGEASNGREAVHLCEQLKPDVAVLDIGMPMLNGIDATTQVLKHSPRTAVIIVSMHSDESYILRALSSGAKCYLLKDSAEDDLLPALRSAVEGRTYFSAQVMDTVVQDYVRFLRQRQLTDSYDLLTDRERETLQVLAEGRSNKEAATLLNVGVSTIETHRMHLMQKLNLHSTAEIVLYAVRKGIIQH